MSFVIAVPEFLSAAATDLANLGSTISAANAAASIPTTGVLAAGADDVSAAIAALFGAHAQAYQTISAQAARAACSASPVAPGWAVPPVAGVMAGAVVSPVWPAPRALGLRAVAATATSASSALKVHPASPASRASPVDIVAAGPSAPRRLLEQLPSVTGPVEALARVEFCGQGVDLIAELG